MESQRSRVRRDRCILSNASNRRHRQQIQIRARGWARTARRPRTADGDPSGLLRNVPPPQERWPRASGGSERAGKGAETTQPASRMIRSAVTLARDLVRRRHPIGASPSRRNAPGRTLSPMPSEQKGAYGGHLALSDVRRGENAVLETAYVPSGMLPLRLEQIALSPYADRNT